MGDIGAGDRPYFSFAYAYWWQWMDVDAANADGGGFFAGDNDEQTLNFANGRDYADEDALFPVDETNCAGGNSYGDNPNSVYDAVLASEATELWTADHLCWVQMRYDMADLGFSTVGGFDRSLQFGFRFESDAANTGNGYFVDDFEAYPGGLWRIQDEDGADNYKAIATNTGISLISTGSQNGAYGDAGASADESEDWNHTAMESPLIRTTAVQAFSGVRVDLQLWVDMAENNGSDGLFIQFSVDGGAWKTVGNTINSYFRQSGYDGAFACNVPYNPGNAFQNDIGCNENGFYLDKLAWTPVSFVIDDATFQDGGTLRFRFIFTTDEANNTGGDGLLIDSIIVYGTNKNYQFVEIYNPTPNPIDLDGPAGANNWRIATDDHTGSADSFDAIRARGGGNAASIPAGGYAILTARNAATKFYDGLYFAPNASAIQLEIDDDFFGNRGLGTTFGVLMLQDDTGALVDSVSYNLVFFDPVEYATQDAVWYNWSTLGTSAAGAQTQFWVTNPTKASNGPGPGVGSCHTSARNQLDTTNCFMLRNPAAATPVEDYDEDDAVELRTGTLDLSRTTASTMGNIEFWYSLNTDVANDDGFLVQLSSLGGNNFVNPFTGVAAECIGKIKDGQAEGGGCVTGTDRVDPNYDSTITSAGSGINGQRVYNTDMFGWRRVAAQLTDFVGTYSILRFYWEADNANIETSPGLYLDDIAVWYHWGGGIFEKTLERKSWRGNSNAGTNWGTSSPNYGTPGYFNSIGTN